VFRFRVGVILNRVVSMTAVVQVKAWPTRKYLDALLLINTYLGAEESGHLTSGQV